MSMVTMLNLKGKMGRQKIQQYLDKVQYRCSARLITIDDIEKMLSCIEKKIGVPKVSLNGTTVKACCKLKPRKYPYTNSRYSYQSTVFEAIFRNNMWFITSIYRECAGYSENNVFCELSETAKEAIASRYRKMQIRI